MHYIGTNIRRIIFFLLIQLCPVIKASDVILLVNDTAKEYPIQKYITVVEDKKKEIDIQDILKNNISFLKDTQGLNYGATHSRYWFKFSLQNSSSKESNLILNIAYPDLNELDFYEVKDSIITRSNRTGENKLFLSRDLLHRYFIFSIKLKPAETKTFYLSACNEGDATFLPVSLMENKAFFSMDESDILNDGICLGLLLFVIIFNIFLNFLIGGKIYMNYTLYAFFLTLFLFCQSGYAFQYLWPSYPWWSNHSLIFFLYVSGAFQAGFVQNLLGVKEQFPKLNLSLNIVKIVLFVCAAITILPISQAIFLYMINIIWIIIGPLYLFFIFISIIYIYKLKYIPSIYLLVGLLLLLLGGLIYTLKDLGLFPVNSFTINSVKYGWILEAFVLTFAVVDRFRRELKDSNKRLKTQQVELIDARDKAEESNRLKSAFLANISHEVRTPMNAIMGFSNLLQKDELPKEKRDFYSDIIIKRSKDLLHIIDGLLNISIIEAGKVVMMDHTFHLSRMIDELLYYFKQRVKDLSKDNIELSLKCTKEIEIISSDELKIRQILTNLLDNAIKFTINGSVEVGCEMANNNMIRFYVKDTGIGIPLDKQSLMFQRFTQIESKLSHKYSGNGIGLSICKNYVEILGGTIWMESTEDVGTTFFFTIPYKTIPAEKKISKD